MYFLRKSLWNLEVAIGQRKSTFLHIFAPTPLLESHLSHVILKFYPDETQHDRPSSAVNESVRKSRPCWAAHTRLGNLGKYPLPLGDDASPGEWVLSQITFTEIMKTVCKPTPRKNPGYAPCYVLGAKRKSVSIVAPKYGLKQRFTRCCSWEVSSKKCRKQIQMLCERWILNWPNALCLKKQDRNQNR